MLIWNSKYQITKQHLLNVTNEQARPNHSAQTGVKVKILVSFNRNRNPFLKHRFQFDLTQISSELLIKAFLAQFQNFAGYLPKQKLKKILFGSGYKGKIFGFKTSTSVFVSYKSDLFAL